LAISGEMADVDLAVVGGGPTGVAALFQAGIEGLSAVGLEAGPWPGAAVGDYLNGLVLISRPSDYEIAGIPLDCRDGNQLTREEVLHYLSRIANYGQLHIRCGEPCTALVPTDGAVVVRTPGGSLRARSVVVTTWYRKRSPSAGLVNPASGVQVIESLHDAVAVAGKATVIVGGGLSAFEQATAIMMQGQKVTIVSRHVLPPAFRTPHFEALVQATRSGIVERAGDLSLRARCLTYRMGLDAEVRSLPCEALVLCLGHEVDPAVLGMLSASGVISEGEIAQVKASSTPDGLIRHGLSVQDAIKTALGAWPDFRSRLLGGVNGIRLAGGGLHIGGAHSGVKVSIQTAVVAVRDVAGHPAPDYLTAPMAGQAVVPLPLALARFVQLPPPEADASLVGRLRPLRIASWTRTTMAMRSRDSFEARPRPVQPGRGEPASAGPAPYLLAPMPDDPRLAPLMGRCDGSRSVTEILEQLGPEADRRSLLGMLRFLWYNNALTWLPPVP
jgi:thioredoxin reductase